MTKIFCNLLIFCIFISFAAYSQNPVMVDFQNKDEVFVKIDDTIKRDDFRPFDLYKVYENRTETDGTIQYSGFVDSVYVWKITADHVLFHYVWQDEWRYIKKGHYLVPCGRKYEINNKEIRSFITTSGGRLKRQVSMSRRKEPIPAHSIWTIPTLMRICVGQRSGFCWVSTRPASRMRSACWN